MRPDTHLNKRAFATVSCDREESSCSWAAEYRARECHARLCSAGAYGITMAAQGVGRMPCREAVIVVIPYLQGDCATPGGGTPRRLALLPCDGMCLFLSIGSILLGVGVLPERSP